MIKKSILLISLMVLLPSFLAVAQAQVYKVVDEDGNVTFTDQPPADGRAPMVLPELSVIETDLPKPEENEAAEAATAAVEPKPEPTPRELRRMYTDFRITRPVQEETFWGTANEVVIRWDSSTPVLPDMSVQIYIDGALQGDAQDNLIAATLDRGEHSVYAQLLDSRGRNIVTTASVKFFVMQRGVGFRPPEILPDNKT